MLKINKMNYVRTKKICLNSDKIEKPLLVRETIKEIKIGDIFTIIDTIKNGIHDTYDAKVIKITDDEIILDGSKEFYSNIKVLSIREFITGVMLLEDIDYTIELDEYILLDNKIKRKDDITFLEFFESLESCTRAIPRCRIKKFIYSEENKNLIISIDASTEMNSIAYNKYYDIKEIVSDGVITIYELTPEKA